VRTTGVHDFLDDTVKEVVLGVDTHLNVHVAVVLWMGWAGTSRRVEDTNDPQGLRTTPPLGTGFRSCKVRRRSRGNRQLRRWARSLPEEGGDRGVRGRETQTPPPPQA
jgi:hypothetical protein